MRSNAPSPDNWQRWQTLVRRVYHHQFRQEWEEARRAVYEAATVAAVEEQRRFASFLGHALDLETQADASPEREIFIIEAALADLNAIPDCVDEAENLSLESLRAQFRWLRVLVTNDLERFTSPEEFEEAERETRLTMVRSRNRMARRLLDQEGKLTKLPAWQHPMTDLGMTAVLRLKSLHEHDPEILKRPAEIIRIIQQEASLSLSALHGSYEAMLRSSLETEAERAAFREDFQQQLDAWRQRPFARDVERLFQVCWSNRLAAEQQEAIRGTVSAAFTEAIMGLIPAYAEYALAKKPEARGRAGVQLVAEIVEAAYQPMMRALLDLCKYGIGRPRSTEELNVGSMVNEARSLWSKIVPGLEAAAKPSLVIIRNAVMHRRFDVTPEGQITLWGGSRIDDSKKLGPLDIDALDALFHETFETCTTFFNAFNYLIHPDFHWLERDHGNKE